MFKFLGSLFARGDNGEKLLDAGIKGIDALYFTEEEKSVASHQLLTTFIDFQKATQAQNLARRYIAFVITGIWAFFVLVLAIFAVLGLETEFKALFSIMKDFVFVPFSGIMAFYFLTHTLRANAKR